MMTPKLQRRPLVLLLLFALSSLSGFATAAEVRKPNVLIVMTDDQGLGDFSFMGNSVLKTPHQDVFARQAVRLTDFHVCPMCSPTRGQLMTGLSALRNGATSVTAGRTFLRPGLTTLPQVFAKAGYQTGIFGKWHLGDSYPHRPFRQVASHEHRRSRRTAACGVWLRRECGVQWPGRRELAGQD